MHPVLSVDTCQVYTVMFSHVQQVLLLLLLDLLQAGCNVLSKLNHHFVGQYFARLLLQCIDFVISQTSLHATVRYTVAVTGTLLHINTAASIPHHEPHDLFQ